MPTNITEL